MSLEAHQICKRQLGEEKNKYRSALANPKTTVVSEPQSVVNWRGMPLQEIFSLALISKMTMSSTYRHISQ
jgi:hypothetical protein